MVRKFKKINTIFNRFNNLKIMRVWFAGPRDETQGVG
jgi:hypothetical protein